ncbi:MAG TPA: AEC family transporter [Pelovirga sp.]|nr:AEC family transporter [Pelovirga sp.]
MEDLFFVFANVTLPVFGIIILGALVGGRLQLEARTLTRAAYYVFVPAFIFHSISTAQIEFSSALSMIGYIVLVHLIGVAIAIVVGAVLKRSREMIAAFVMIASFGNVGNYGLALIRFRLGDEAIASATIFYVAITISAFIMCVGAAGWARGGKRGALWQVVKTPALLAMIPAVLVSSTDLQVPLMVQRMVGLLAEAMIPVMLFTLGLQMLEQKKIQFNTDVFLGSGLRLFLVPFIAVLVARGFSFGAIEQTAGILQAAMPAAILVAIIAKEHDVVPEFVTSVVIVSTLISVATLTLWMVVL